MDTQAVIRGIAYIALVVALLATAIVLGERQKGPNTETPAAADNSDAELIRCNLFRKEAANTVACKAVWQARRERFLNAKRAYAKQDRLAEPGSPLPNPNEPTAAGQEQWPVPAASTGRPQ